MSLVRLGELDCVVGGATVPTAELLRPALQIVGTRRDAAIVPEPNQAELVEIGQSVAAGVKSLFGIDPYLALLSFSTNGSGGQKLPSVLKVRQAAEELTGQGYRVLGETQFDAAYDAQTRLYKWNRSLIHAPNVYIFPNLDAANIGYKIMKLTGNYQAIGPIIVGLNRPVNDLSRGCDWREVYHLSLISLAMSISPKTQLTEELAVGHLDPAEKSERG
ncbi:uncharacterized protein LOC111615737 [Centruroides sculpturatus]|uniref:uncharacterized protein LOC111615737 n=1 Tax=Centruroides sculpturatus TaxID=218467 RepID=UPI000C6CD3CD|nr:uncharacterized protein LOC111615737 [Centruroides sculpturatus]